MENAGDLIAHDKGEGWRLAVLAGENLNETFKAMKLFNSQNAPRVVADVLEVRAATVSKIENTVDGKDVKLGTEKDVTPLFEFSTTATNDPDRRQPGLVTADTDDLNRVDSGVRCSAPSAPVRR